MSKHANSASSQVKKKKISFSLQIRKKSSYDTQTELEFSI
jgi:hypothetical protein